MRQSRRGAALVALRAFDAGSGAALADFGPRAGGGVRVVRWVRRVWAALWVAAGGGAALADFGRLAGGLVRAVRRVRRVSAAFVALWVVAGGGMAFADCGPAPASDAELIAQPEAAGAIAEADATMPNADGRLWRIDTAPPSFLVGTFHIAAGGIERPGPVVDALVRGASGVVVEVDVARLEAELARLASHPENLFREDGSRLSDTLTAAETAQAEEVLAQYGMPLVVADQMRPIFLAGLLGVPACQLDRADDAGLDANIEALARRSGVAVTSLETVAEQIDALEAEPATMDKVLRLMLTEAGGYEDDWFTTLALYRTRHIGAMWTMSRRAMADLVGEDDAAAIADAFWETLVASRNRRMVARMLPGLREGGRVVAVGALHLPGEDGIVALLRQAGFAVTRVMDDPHPQD